MGDERASVGDKRTVTGRVCWHRRNSLESHLGRHWSASGGGGELFCQSAMEVHGTKVAAHPISAVDLDFQNKRGKNHLGSTRVTQAGSTMDGGYPRDPNMPCAH